MSKEIIARWQDWSGKGLEHLVLDEDPDEIVAEAAIIGTVDDELFGARYRILCDGAWQVTDVEVSQIGNERWIQLSHDGAGNWIDSSQNQNPIEELRGATDVDISVTPFTNTIPIRRLKLNRGEAKEILVVYVQLPGLKLSTDRQRYTCLEPNKLYRYESLDSEFTRDIEVDADGLVVTYPGLFRRVI
jgi:uncharacterized protein